MKRLKVIILRVQVVALLIFMLLIGFIYSNLDFYKKIPQPKKIMFIAHTETMGGKGVYELYGEMKKVGHEVKIIAIPNFYSGSLVADIDFKFFSKFPKDDVIYPCGKWQPYDKCESIENCKSDYIFTQNPYDSVKESVLDPIFTNESLRKITNKLAYIVYGPHLFHQTFINDKNLPKLVDCVFVDSNSTKDIYKKYYNFSHEKIIVSGYQTYKSIRDDLKTNKKKNEKLTILWLPRWFLTFWGRDL